MENAHLRMGLLEYERYTDKIATRIRVRVSQYIGDSDGAHLLSVFGNDSDVGAITAAVYEQARFRLLSAAGSSARSRIRYARVMGMKEDNVRKIGFTRLAMFRPGIIAGNAHTPGWVGWLGRLVPGPFGTIDQRILARSIAAEIALHSQEAGEVICENAALKKLAAQLGSGLGTH